MVKRRSDEVEEWWSIAVVGLRGYEAKVLLFCKRYERLRGEVAGIGAARIGAAGIGGALD